MKRIPTFGAGIVLFAACATAPTVEEIAAADLGPRPQQSDCEQFALARLRDHGLTPSNSTIEFAPLRRGYYRENSFSPVRFAWQLDVQVEPGSRGQRRATGAGRDEFYWVDGRCVAYSLVTRMFDGSKVRSLVIVDERDATGSSDHETTDREPDRAAPKKPAGGRIDVLLARRSTLRDMRFEAQDDPEQIAAIDLLLTAVDRQLKQAGYSGR